MDGSYSAYIKSYQDFFSNILKLLKHLSKNDFEQVFRLLLELRKWADDDEMRCVEKKIKIIKVKIMTTMTITTDDDNNRVS